MLNTHLFPLKPFHLQAEEGAERVATAGTHLLRVGGGVRMEAARAAHYRQMWPGGLAHYYLPAHGQTASTIIAEAVRRGVTVVDVDPEVSLEVLSKICIKAHFQNIAVVRAQFIEVFEVHDGLTKRVKKLSHYEQIYGVTVDAQPLTTPRA